MGDLQVRRCASTCRRFVYTARLSTLSDAADECSLSRIYGGSSSSSSSFLAFVVLIRAAVHPPFDDVVGRRIGRLVSEAAWRKTIDVVGAPTGSRFALRLTLRDAIRNLFLSEKARLVGSFFHSHR